MEEAIFGMTLVVSAFRRTRRGPAKAGHYIWILFPIIEAALNARADRFDRLRLTDEQVFGKLPVPEDLRVNRTALVEVQAEPGKILQPQIAIAVDVRILEPLLQIDRAAAVAREHVDRRVEADVMQRLDDGRIVRTVQLRLDRVDVDANRSIALLAEQHQVVALAVVGIAQTTPFGNASKKVPISLFTAAVLLSYSCTKSVTTPPGVRCAFADSKNSRV